MLTFPNAKINLGLYVVERRADGYHNLQTVFYPIPLCDTLEVTPAKNLSAPYSLTMSGRKIEGAAEANLVVRVLNSLRADFELPPLDICLSKKIPTGAGLGGGSSDAAFMMKMLNKLFSLGLTDEQMRLRVAKLGADCAFFIDNRPAYATGIGDCLTPISLNLSGYYLTLVKPQTSVSTAEAYAQVVPRKPAHELLAALRCPVESWRETVSNDFEPSVFSAHPEIGAIKETLYDMGALYASMSGSGSTVFAISSRPLESAPKVFSNCYVKVQQLRMPEQ